MTDELATGLIAGFILGVGAALLVTWVRRRLGETLEEARRYREPQPIVVETEETPGQVVWRSLGARLKLWLAVLLLACGPILILVFLFRR